MNNSKTLVVLLPQVSFYYSFQLLVLTKLPSNGKDRAVKKAKNCVHHPITTATAIYLLVVSGGKILFLSKAAAVIPAAPGQIHCLSFLCVLSWPKRRICVALLTIPASEASLETPLLNAEPLLLTNCWITVSALLGATTNR
jgi:hypothetical protein